MKNISMKMVFIIAIIIVAVCFLTIFAFQEVQNKAIALQEQITTAQSEIKIQEKRRADLIPNLVDCVKEYDEHEYQTLMDVVKARGTNSDDVANEIKTMIAAVAEAYPTLQSNTNYQQLMVELTTTENIISTVRENYNTWVGQYNIHVKKFPNKQILDMLGYVQGDYQKLDFNVSEDAPTNLFD